MYTLAQTPPAFWSLLAAGVRVRGDRELLRRAFGIVLRDAIRHAPEGSEVRVRLETAPGWGSVAVRDRGPGLLVELELPADPTATTT